MKSKLPPSETANLDSLTIEYERFFSVSIDMLCISSFDGHFKKVNPGEKHIQTIKNAVKSLTSILNDFLSMDKLNQGNITQNAIKYSPSDSTINIVTGLENNDMFLQVHDQGIGIPVTDQKHLSELFFRANNVHNVTGTGLGLNSVKRYLKLMGGSFDFKSVENVGSVFIIKLPLEAKI